ncbi:MAG TPA: glucose-6-phosphate dehydrogenase [Methylophilaceae bacterium]|nr:glucose-6-phosphate dehydrogenase [Methylophilaceae bacterium]
MSSQETIPGPCHFVIFGATGNLATIKLLPCLYNLEVAGRIPGDMSILALGRQEHTQESWLAHLSKVLHDKFGDKVDPAVAERFAKRFSYMFGDLREAAFYQRLKDKLAEPREGSCSNIVFYLSIIPKDFNTVINFLDEFGFSQPRGLHRIVVEKPFGTDLESAQLLNRSLHKHFDEEQIYRIDHYLGKETVQNLLVYRFANTLIEPLWNRNYINHVQITVAEDFGIGTRADYYDKSGGAMRDMLQNHLMQLLTVVAMEPPATMEADAVRDEKVKVLKSMRIIPEDKVNEHVVRAQYAAGTVRGQPVHGYMQESGVDPESSTETFTAAKFYIDNWRWRGVPFYLRTGKRMAKTQSTIAIRFRHPPQHLFHDESFEHIEPNWIYLSLQPTEHMHMEMHVRAPGLGMDTRVVSLNASYRQEEDEKPLEAYQALLLDVIRGDKTLFIRFDEVEWAWRVVEPILKVWGAGNVPVHSYPAGTWGPEETSSLFDCHDQAWRND